MAQAHPSDLRTKSSQRAITNKIQKIGPVFILLFTETFF